MKNSLDINKCIKYKSKNKIFFDFTIEDKIKICRELRIFKANVYNNKVFVYEDNGYKLILSASSKDYLINKYIESCLSSVDCDLLKIVNEYYYSHHSICKISFKELDSICNEIELSKSTELSLLEVLDPYKYADVKYNDCINKLEKLGFKYVNGILQNTNMKNDIYYKKKIDNTYLICWVGCKHIKTHNYCIDLYEGEYKKEKDIGNKLISNPKVKQLSFDIYKQLNLLS